MPSPKRGDIFWVDVHTREVRGSEQDKPRPYIIVSIDALNSVLPIVIGVPLSSNIQKQNAHRILVGPSDIINEPGTRGCQPGVALIEQVRVLSTVRLGTDVRLARLTPTAMAKVEAALAYVLGIPP